MSGTSASDTAASRAVNHAASRVPTSSAGSPVGFAVPRGDVAPFAPARSASTLAVVHTALRVRALFAMLFGLVVLFAGVFGAAGAASAHGGPFQLLVSPDGAGGVVVSAQYTADQHTVSEIMDPVATAVSPDGQRVGPVSLISSSEGEGIWVSDQPFLPEGQWAVTVATTFPSSATVTVDMTVAPLAAPIESGETIAAVETAKAEAAAQAASVRMIGLWILAAVVVLAVVGAFIFRLRRRPAAADAVAGSAADATDAPAHAESDTSPNASAGSATDAADGPGTRPLAGSSSARH
ncbi:hypothetical protein ACL9RL_08700 [Plantibacter sp. Mn2098]|uniref:hypothetical protein n=1 Tax=Plantibacter sp. Mn2098 TaxID=3395266 RepID=UPI003BE717E2